MVEIQVKMMILLLKVSNRPVQPRQGRVAGISTPALSYEWMARARRTAQMVGDGGQGGVREASGKGQ